MDHFAWDDAYNTGNQTIDKEHGQIFLAANMIHKAVSQHQEGAILEKALALLVKYTVFHFKHEIDFYKSIGTTVLKEHVLLHDELVVDVQLLRKSYGQIPNEILSHNLEDWIENKLLAHIKVNDMLALNSVSNPF